VTHTLRYCRAQHREHARALRLLRQGVRPSTCPRYCALVAATRRAWANLPPAAKSAIQEPKP
jgi:hypothetical protein